MWPLILRELRGGSRRWTTYWLRLLGATAVVTALFFWFAEDQSSKSAGSELFAAMHRIVFCAIWILAPLITCDCLSQERREGTLGLLFLTNLKSWEIVAAKTFAHGLRSLTIWLATLPIIAVPLLLGGLHWKELLMSVGFMLSAVSLGTAAGMVASSVSTGISRAAGGALCLSGLLFICFGIVTVFSLNAIAAFFSSRNLFPYLSFAPIVEVVAVIVFNVDGAWHDLLTSTTRPAQTPNAILAGIFAVAFCSFFSLLLIVLLCAWRIRRHWQDKPKTKRQTEAEKLFYSPIFMTGLFRRWMRRSLERNPIGWLEKRTWAGRMGSWIWFSIMISFATTLAYGTSAGYGGFGYFGSLMWMLLVSMAYVAAGSFRRERETGALELILVTPLSERQIIFGRLHGLWTQFLPTFAIWIVMLLYLSVAVGNWQYFNVLEFAVLYIVVPVVGLYFSLRTRLILLAWLTTLAVCFGLPQLVWWGCNELLTAIKHVGSDGLVFRVELPRLGIQVPVQLTIGALLLWRLKLNLTRRTFSFR